MTEVEMFSPLYFLLIVIGVLIGTAIFYGGWWLLDKITGVIKQ